MGTQLPPRKGAYRPLRYFPAHCSETVAQKSVISIRVRTRYMDKNNGDGVETKNSFTLGVIEVAVPGLEEATSGLTKLLPVERQPLQV